MDSYLIEINAVSSDGEKFNCAYITTAKNIVDAFNIFDQSETAHALKIMTKNGYYTASCHRLGTKGTARPTGCSRT